MRGHSLGVRIQHTGLSGWGIGFKW